VVHASSFTLPSSYKTELVLLHKQALRAAERVRCYLFVVVLTPLAARVHQLTRGEQQGNPGQHSNDVAPSLRKTKRSLEATDASGRPLAVVQLFDNLQQPSTWEVSPRTKHEVERLLRSDVSSRLVHPALQKPVTAAIQGACFRPRHFDPKY
jgi:hypothetical protein